MDMNRGIRPPLPRKKASLKKNLNKLRMYNITTLHQIQNPDTLQILSPKEFK